MARAGGNETGSGTSGAIVDYGGRPKTGGGQGKGSKRAPAQRARVNNQPGGRAHSSNPRPAPAPKQTTTSRTGTVSGGGGGGVSFGGGGSSFAAAAPAPAPEPPMSIADWLAKDTTYQSQQSALQKALADYGAQMNKQKANYDVSYTRQLDDLGENKTRSLDDQKNDFASRGMLFSGVYGQDVSRLSGDFAKREGDMATGRSNWLDDLTTNFANYKDQQQLTEEKAKQDAIARRAAQFGL